VTIILQHGGKQFLNTYSTCESPKSSCCQ